MLLLRYFDVLIIFITFFFLKCVFDYFVFVQSLKVIRTLLKGD